MPFSNLRGILKYVPAFRDRIFVIAVDGEILDSPNFDTILLDLAVLRSLSIQIILIHGAGHQIRKLATHRGKVPTNTDGDGVTDQQTLNLSLDASSRLSNELMRRLAAADLDAAYANAVQAHPIGIEGGTDYQYTGRVAKIDTEMLRLFLRENIIPIIPPIGFDGEGGTYRVNSDAIAVAVAQELQAVKIIFLTPHRGLIGANDTLCRQIPATQVNDIFEHNRSLNPPGLRSKAYHAGLACGGKTAIPRVHLLNGNDNAAILGEIFRNDGVGTMIYSDEYAKIRMADKRDVRPLLAIIAANNPRPEEMAEHKRILDRFPQDHWLIEVDRQPVGFIRLVHHAAERQLEVAEIYLAPEHRGKDYGRRLLDRAEDLARTKNADSLVSLSRQLYQYLKQKAGFQEDETPARLPRRLQHEYETSPAKPHVLIKPIERSVGVPPA